MCTGACGIVFNSIISGRSFVVDSGTSASIIVSSSTSSRIIIGSGKCNHISF
jgi:hypothetical protein